MNPTQRQCEPEDEAPGSAFAGCLWGLFIMLFLALAIGAFLAVAWLTDRGEAQMQPSFDPITTTNE